MDCDKECLSDRNCNEVCECVCVRKRGLIPSFQVYVWCVHLTIEALNGLINITELAYYYCTLSRNKIKNIPEVQILFQNLLNFRKLKILV